MGVWIYGFRPTKTASQTMKEGNMYALRGVVAALLVVAIGSGCGDDEGSAGPDGGSINQDPYAGLWNAGLGEIKCKGDSCCFRRCEGNQDTICVTRDSALILTSVAPKAPFTETCDQLVFPEWFYNLDCFVGVGGIVNPVTGEELKYVANTYNSESKQLYIGFLQCFCGRTATTYSSQYSSGSQAFRFEGCGQPMVGIDLASGEEGYDESFVTCSNPCNPCTPQCGARQCGSDGCGGTCGSCAPGKTCSAAGQCVSEQDTCSACLAACRGLPSCCTGCGCICESACGQCL